MRTDTLFLTLNIFSATGGIEKVCRILGKALYERSVEKQERLMIWSMHDKAGDATDNIYFPTELYKSYSAGKMRFVKDAVHQGIQSRVVILSHINLLSVGWIIKKTSPATKVILMAHGIEVWGQLSEIKTAMLRSMNKIWAVSNYTRSVLTNRHGLDVGKTVVLNNCLDPFLEPAKNISVPVAIYERYGIDKDDKILFTLSRLSSKEKYKGYEDVIKALQEINDPKIKYIIAGKADEVELDSVKTRISVAGLENNIVLAGYIADREVAAHYKMSDCYIMPSSGEGFGVSFIEAMYYGVPVIGGNGDGSMDALMNGELGTAVTPGNIKEIKNAVMGVLQKRTLHVPSYSKLMGQFGYQNYKMKLSELLNNGKQN